MLLGGFLYGTDEKKFWFFDLHNIKNPTTGVYIFDSNCPISIYAMSIIAFSIIVLFMIVSAIVIVNIKSPRYIAKCATDLALQESGKSKSRVNVDTATKEAVQEATQRLILDELTKSTTVKEAVKDQAAIETAKILSDSLNSINGKSKKRK